MIGRNWFRSPAKGFWALTVDSMGIVGFDLDRHRLSLMLQLFDEYNAPTLVVHEGELMHSPTKWDIEQEGPTFTIRDAL